MGKNLFYFLLGKSKPNGENCTGLINECDSTVGISCIMINKIKQCA